MNTQQHHYFGSTAYGWAAKNTREEVIADLASQAGESIIKRQVKVNGGLYCYTIRVDAPVSAPYGIRNYMPQGVPLSEKEEYYIVKYRGKGIARRIEK